MKRKDVEAAVRQAVRSLKEETTAVQREAFVYSKIVGVCYDDIRELHEEGYSLEKICRSLEENSLLPDGADSDSFRKAWRRERKRREECPIKQRKGNNGDDTQKKSGPGNSELPDGKSTVKEGDATELARIRKLISTTVETGTGTIVKHPNGSFDF